MRPRVLSQLMVVSKKYMDIELNLYGTFWKYTCYVLLRHLMVVINVSFPRKCFFIWDVESQLMFGWVFFLIPFASISNMSEDFSSIPFLRWTMLQNHSNHLPFEARKAGKKFFHITQCWGKKDKARVPSLFFHESCCFLPVVIVISLFFPGFEDL